MLNPTDLREILRYVPQFRDRTFVIALDGAVVEEGNFRNLLLDVALLRSLNVDVVLVHGAAHQIQSLARMTGQQTSDLDGTGVTDSTTLQLAIMAASRVTHELLEGLHSHDLRGAYGNVITAHPAGILHGVDFQWTGRVERVDIDLLQGLLQRGVVPVVAPIGCDGEGRSYRLNSDSVAVEVAKALRAVKLIFVTTSEGIQLRTIEPGKLHLLRQLSIEEAEAILRKQRGDVPAPQISKLEHAVRAIKGNVPRVHVIDGRVETGLLAEVFSNEGIGTLIHSNEYQSIRRATRKDVRALYQLIQEGVQNDELVARSRAEIERQINDYFVFELDKNVVACAALHPYPEQNKAELACVCVDRRYENRGIGGRLMHYAEDQARERGISSLFCLSTQAFNFFQQKGGFTLGSVDDLPPARRERYDRSGRHSLVLVKSLKGPG
jgi:amino-acid N-acetyltransferase